MEFQDWLGAVRSGKSFVDISFVIPYRLRQVREEKGLNVILGVSKETIERNVLQPMREIYTSDVVGLINSRNIAKVCGVDVYCLGAEKVSQVAKIQGSSIKYCYGDEIAKWNQEVFYMLQSRLDKEYSTFDGACNPEYPSHWLKEFIDRPDIDSYIQHYTIFDNPFLPKEFVENLCREYEGTVYYERYIKGNWTIAEGLIYPMYEEAITEPPEDIPILDRCLSIDYGTQNAFACMLWQKQGNTWYGIDEYYYSGRAEGTQKTDGEYKADLDRQFEHILNQGKRIETIIDPSAASFIALLKRDKRYRVRPADNDVLDGIRDTAMCLKNGWIKISPKCKKWYREVQGYIWDDKSAEDRPVKEEDHCLTGDTLVLTNKGETPIRELVNTSGNVWSYNTRTGKKELKPYSNCRLTRKKTKVYKITTEDGRIIKCTEDHPILTQRGYVQLKYLDITDKIIDISD